ncbi:hypothetical protein Q604_UNBC16475G0001, partial [human gut metagenome]
NKSDYGQLMGEDNQPNYDLLSSKLNLRKDILIKSRIELLIDFDNEFNITSLSKYLDVSKYPCLYFKLLTFSTTHFLIVFTCS